MVGSLYFRDGAKTEPGQRATDAAGWAWGNCGSSHKCTILFGTKGIIRDYGWFQIFFGFWVVRTGLQPPQAVKGRSPSQPHRRVSMGSFLQSFTPRQTSLPSRGPSKNIQMDSCQKPQPPQSRVTHSISGHSQAFCGNPERGERVTPKATDSQKEEGTCPGAHVIPSRTWSHG